MRKKRQKKFARSRKFVIAKRKNERRLKIVNEPFRRLSNVKSTPSLRRSGKSRRRKVAR